MPPTIIAVDMRRKEAEARTAERGNRSDKQQIAKLDKMFGKGKGAQRERARLTKKEG